jgi:hypothetical protein
MRLPLIAGLALPLVAGCYSYRPLPSVDTAMPAAGTQVEAQLTTAGATALANEIGPDILSLQGQVLAADSASLTLAVARTATARHIEYEWKGEQVTVPRAAIANLRQRKFAVGPSVLIGGLAGGSVVAAYALFGTSGSSTIPAAPPPTGHQ